MTKSVEMASDKQGKLAMTGLTMALDVSVAVQGPYQTTHVQEGLQLLEIFVTKHLLQ